MSKNKYAVIQLLGKQHQVKEGDVLTVDRMDLAENKSLKTNDVLLVVDGADRQIGTPLVDKASVTLKALSHQKGKKIRVAKFKAKSRYRRVMGHRQRQTTLEVVKISNG